MISRMLKAKNLPLYVAIIVLAVIGIGAYYYSHNFEPEDNPLKSYFSPLYTTLRSDGTIAWYEYENGSLVQHPAPAAGKVVGLASADNATYFSVAFPHPSTISAIYRFKDGVYSQVYTDSAHTIQQFSVSPDGSHIGFIEPIGSTTEAFVLDVASVKVTALGPSILAPQFLTEGDSAAVVYASGTDLLARVYSGGIWQATHTLFTGTEFSMNAFATNGKKQFAFRNSRDGTIQEWSVSSLQPFAVAAKALHAPIQSYSLVYGGDTLFGYKYALVEDKGYYTHLTITDLSSGSGKMYFFTPLSSLDASSNIFLLSLPTLQ